MTGFRDLERQLLKSVRRRAAAHALSPRRWRGHRMALALAPLALIGGVATAATQLGHGGSTESRGRDLAFRAVKDTRHVPACRSFDARDVTIVDDPPPPEFAAVLPELAAAPPRPIPSDALTFARRTAGRAILGRTVRLIAVGGGRRLLVFVAYGGPFTVVDPQGCLRARSARLAVLAPDANDPVRKVAQRVLDGLRDTKPEAKALNLLVLPPGHSGPSFGTSIGLESRVPLRSGILVYGSGVYVGIAKRGATSITLRPARKGARRGVRRRVAVHRGLFAFSLPRHTGPIVLTQRAADDRALGSERLRK